MTCASCANRIERRLNKLDGVAATVNYATETATVEYDAARRGRRSSSRRSRPPATAPPLPPPSTTRRAPAEDDDAAAPLRRRLVVSALLSLPVLLMSMIPALQFDNWQWLSLQLATPVVLWGAWPFHRAAWANLKHATATMDTLISRRHARRPGSGRCTRCSSATPATNDMRMEFDLIPSSGGGANEIYLETAAIVTTFILAGRYFEARAKRRAGAALQGAARARRQGRRASSTPTAPSAACRSSSSQPGRPLRRAPGREGRHRRHRRGRPLRRRHEHAHRRVGPGRGRARLRGRRRDRQRRRPPRRARHARRRRHRARADRPPGHRGADRQGAGAAARRPRLGHLRPGRLRRSPSPRSRFWLGAGAERDVRLHRRRRRADHRLPVRARASPRRPR